MSKGFIRIGGTALGGILGFLVMLRPVLATRSVPLAAILLPINFVVACFGHTQFKVRPHYACIWYLTQERVRWVELAFHATMMPVWGC